MKFINTLVGCGIFGLIAAVNNDFGTFLFISVACTAGVSLVIWLPIAWAVGAFVTMVYTNITKSLRNSAADREEGTTSSFATDPQSNRMTAAQDYIDKAFASGMHRDEVSDRMADSGWSHKDIRKLLGNDTAPTGSS